MKKIIVILIAMALILSGCEKELSATELKMWESSQTMMESIEEPEAKEGFVEEMQRRIEPESPTPVELDFSKEDITNTLFGILSDHLGEDEYMKRVELDDDTLWIYVDLINTDPAPLTMELLVESRSGGITDELLRKTEYDGYWERVIIDFGDVGYVEADKSMIRDNGYGRYFEFPLDRIKNNR